jgi:halimadienyl-diphosphate synthase
MDINAEMILLLARLDSGNMSCSAYDTAWIAQLGEMDRELSNQAMAWLIENQLSGGSWGAEKPFYYHDRVVNTLAAMLALTRFGRRSQDRKVIENGLAALDRITSLATSGLAADLNGATVGFEMIVPTMVEEAEQLGIIKDQKNRILGRLGQSRIKKIEMLKGNRISRQLTYAFSSEMAGLDGQNILDIENLQEANGSVGNSPAATAYFALHVRPADAKALAYLRRTIPTGCGVPFATPFDIFERAWVLWNFSLLLPFGLEKEIVDACIPHLDFLEAAWKPGRGVGFAASYTPCDGDDTGLTLDVLQKFGRKADFATLLRFEEKEYFHCYPLEADPSISANIHILKALKVAGFDRQHPAVQKALGFLKRNHVSGKYWFDKWHTSPYYSSSHAIIACQGFDDDMCSSTIDWILATQNADGSWGSSGFPTAEETAYCIQALIYWKVRNGHVSQKPIEQAVRWLNEHQTDPYPPLWIGKGLYCPQYIVQSAILSALGMALQESGVKL